MMLIESTKAKITPPVSNCVPHLESSPFTAKRDGYDFRLNPSGLDELIFARGCPVRSTKLPANLQRIGKSAVLQASVRSKHNAGHWLGSPPRTSVLGI